MVKAILTITKRPDMSSEDFRTYYLQTHSQIVAKLPGLRRYIQNPALRDAGVGEPHLSVAPDVWGVAELWFDDMETARRALASPAAAAAAVDLPKFVVPEKTTILMVDEVEVALPQ